MIAVALCAILLGTWYLQHVRLRRAENEARAAMLRAEWSRAEAQKLAAAASTSAKSGGQKSSASPSAPPATSGGQNSAQIAELSRQIAELKAANDRLRQEVEKLKSAGDGRSADPNAKK
jgi:outer membrane murein-binding lipoprotein Lpp